MTYIEYKFKLEEIYGFSYRKITFAVYQYLKTRTQFWAISTYFLPIMYMNKNFELVKFYYNDINKFFCIIENKIRFIPNTCFKWTHFESCYISKFYGFLMWYWIHCLLKAWQKSAHTFFLFQVTHLFFSIWTRL